MYQRARRGISYLPQEASVFRKLSVEDNLMAILQTLPLNRRERRERMNQLIEQLGLEQVRQSKGYVLSGGERRRVEIARSLVIEPSFLLLDEPFSGIDPIQVLELQKIIFDLKRAGIGILVTDHNVRETLAVTDRAYIINNGRIFRSGSPEALGNDPEVRRVYLGENFNTLELQSGRWQVPAWESEGSPLVRALAGVVIARPEGAVSGYFKAAANANKIAGILYSRTRSVRTLELRRFED